MAQVERLPSKIVQYNNTDDVALCEDGSVWYYYDPEKKWTQIHPPHEPPKQAADLAEALKVLRMLAEYACFDYGKQHAQCLEAFNRAWETLRKHGA